MCLIILKKYILAKFLDVLKKSSKTQCKKTNIDKIEVLGVHRL